MNQLIICKNEDDATTFTQTVTSTPSVTVNAGCVMGNRIRIVQNTAATALSLAEVQVYATDFVTSVKATTFPELKI